MSDGDDGGLTIPLLVLLCLVGALIWVGAVTTGRWIYCWFHGC